MSDVSRLYITNKMLITYSHANTLELCCADTDINIHYVHNRSEFLGVPIFMEPTVQFVIQANRIFKELDFL